MAPVRPPEIFNRCRRGIERLMDQAGAMAMQAISSHGPIEPFDGKPRFALLTVNYSTTPYLKLMLRTLVEQKDLDLLTRVVVCDNNSQDGEKEFLRELVGNSRRVEIIERRLWTDHAPGMRGALRELDRSENDLALEQRSNILLFMDTDVIFLRKDTLTDLARVFVDGTMAFAGELRHHLYSRPEAQASFLAVRRDWAARKDISPWVNHSSPTWWLQRDIWRRGGIGVDFRSNHDGYVLHKGRSGVAAALEHAPWSGHAAATSNVPHFMGVPNGAAIWAAKEEEYSEWMEEEAEPELVRLLSSRLA